MKINSRIFLPKETHSVHASTISFFNDKPIFSWFGGTSEGQPDVTIYLHHGNELLKLAKKDGVPRWNPILFEIANKLYLFVKVGVFCDRWQTVLYDVSSLKFDSNPMFLPSGINGPVKTKPIIVDDVIYCGSSFETMWDWTSYIEYFEYNSDFNYKGRSNPLTVEKNSYYNEYYGKTLYSLGIIQPSLFHDKVNKVIHAFFRSSHGLNAIYHSYCRYSDNDQWSVPKPTDFPNPNSGIDTVSINDRLFLIYNPSMVSRSPLILSELEIKNKKNEFSFKKIDEITIQDSINEKEKTMSLELSYPYMIENNGTIHLTYTYGRSLIEYVTVEI